MKIRPVGDESLHPDAQTDWQTDRRDEANSHLPKFYERASPSKKKIHE